MDEIVNVWLAHLPVTMRELGINDPMLHQRLEWLRINLRYTCEAMEAEGIDQVAIERAMYRVLYGVANPDEHTRAIEKIKPLIIDRWPDEQGFKTPKV